MIYVVNYIRQFFYLNIYTHNNCKQTMNICNNIKYYISIECYYLTTLKFYIPQRAQSQNNLDWYINVLTYNTLYVIYYNFSHPTSLSFHLVVLVWWPTYEYWAIRYLYLLIMKITKIHYWKFSNSRCWNILKLQYKNVGYISKWK